MRAFDSFLSGVHTSSGGILCPLSISQREVEQRMKGMGVVDFHLSSRYVGSDFHFFPCALLCSMGPFTGDITKAQLRAG